MVSQRAYLYDRFVSLNDRFTDLLNHRTKQKLMIEKTFEKKWADNRQRLLQEDEEYQRILRSYRKHNWADALVAPAALIGSMEFVAWLGVKSQVLNFVISLVLAIVFFLCFPLFQGCQGQSQDARRGGAAHQGGVSSESRRVGHPYDASTKQRTHRADVFSLRCRDPEPSPHPAQPQTSSCARSHTYPRGGCWGSGGWRGCSPARSRCSGGVLR